VADGGLVGGESDDYAFDTEYCLKACAERAELDQDEFWLHKFRATFATWHLWAGIDLSTVQLWLGHKDLASTMRYLKPSRSQATRDKVNATFAAGGAQ
jgi:integrase/recombinase XerD